MSGFRTVAVGLLACAAFVGGSPLAGQLAVVSGTVRALDGGVPIMGVQVSISGTKARVLTDQRGHFRFEGLSEGAVELSFEVLGFGSVTRRVVITGGESNELHVELSEVAVEVDPLHVLLKRTRMVGDPLQADLLPGSAHLLTVADLESPEFVFDNVHDFLRTIPGVNVQDEDGYGLRPNIGLRGTGVERSSKITLMEDGVLIAPAPYGAPSAYYFPIAGRMEAIEVRKGSSQVKYGPRTIGGAINLVSTSIPDSLSLLLDVSGGEDNTLKTRAWVGNASENYGWLVESYRIQSAGFKQLPGQDTGFDIEDYVGKFRLNTSRDAETYQSLELKLGYYDERSDETYLGLTEDDFARTPFLRYPASRSDVMNADHTQLQLSHFLQRGRLDLTTTAYRNDFSRNWFKLQSVSGSNISSVLDDPDANVDALAILKGGDSEVDALKVRANNRDYFGRGVQTNLALQLDELPGSHALELGVRYHEDQEDRFQWEDGFQMVGGEMVLTSRGVPGTQSNRVTDADAWAFYLSDEITLGRLVLSPGVRYETIDFTRTDYAKDDPGRISPSRVIDNGSSAWIPGIGFNLDVDGGAHLFGGIHKGFGPPGAGADSETQSEESVNYELGGRLRRSGFAGQVTGFFSNYSNILGRSTLANGESGTGFAFNGGEVDVVGVEASGDYDLAWGSRGRIRVPLRLTYTYTQAEFRSSFESGFSPWGSVESGDRLPYLPEHQVSGSLGVEAPAWSLTLSGSGTSRTRTTAGQGTIDLHESVEGYVVLNLAGEVHIPGFGTAYVGLQNLTDRAHSVARRPAGLRPGLPRTIASGFRIRR